MRNIYPFIEAIVISIGVAVVLSLVSGFVMLISFNKALEVSLQIITLVLGLMLSFKIAKQGKYVELLNGLLISIIYTFLTVEFYQDLNPNSQDGVISICSTVVIFVDFYYLLLTGLLLSITQLIRRSRAELS